MRRPRSCTTPGSWATCITLTATATATIRGQNLTCAPQATRTQPEGYSSYGWPEKLRNEYLANFEKEHPAYKVKVEEGTQVFAAPEGYSDVVDHQINFFNAVRSRKKVVENEEFGNNAALGCHLANYSYFKNTPAIWDAGAKKIRS